MWDWENKKKIYNKGTLRYWVREVGTAGGEHCQRQPCLFKYQMMLPPTAREDLSDKPGLCCCCSTHRSWHTYTHKYTKPKNKPTQREIQREELNMLDSVNCKKGCEICVGDKSGMQHFQRKAHFFFFLQRYSVRWYMLWLWTSKMLTNSYFFFDLPGIFIFLFFFYLSSCITFRLWQSFYGLYSELHL